MRAARLHFAVPALVALLAACAAPAPRQKAFTLLYPAPPELPRLQWLASFTTAKDIEREPSAFERFVVGEEKRIPRLDKPYGVALARGKIYACDTNRTVMVFDLERRSFERLAGAQGPGRLVQPVNISVDEEGFKYVADPVRGQVVVFDAADAYVQAFGAPGGWKPVDAVASGGLLFIADIKNGAVVVLDKKNGRLVRRIGREGEPAAKLYLPTNLAFGPDGTLYVSDAGKFCIVKYGIDGEYRGSIGKLGTTPGTFARPKGIAVDRDGRLFAVDAAFSNVQVFDRDGLLLLWFGQFGRTGRDPGDLFLPAKVAVSYDSVPYFQRLAAPGFEIDHLVLVTSQFGDRMVNVYGFGKESGRQYPSDAELRQRLEERLRQAQPFLPGPVPEAPGPPGAAAEPPVPAPAAPAPERPPPSGSP